MKTTTYTLNKQSEKAINVTFTAEDLGEVTTWLPKSSASIADGELTVKPAFWKHKEAELRMEGARAEARKADEGDMLVSGDIQEYEKSYGVLVTVYENMSEQSRRCRMFLPKSMASRTTDGVRVVGWMLRKAVERVKEQYETGSFSASCMEVSGFTATAI